MSAKRPNEWRWCLRPQAFKDHRVSSEVSCSDLSTGTRKVTPKGEPRGLWRTLMRRRHTPAWTCPLCFAGRAFCFPFALLFASWKIPSMFVGLLFNLLRDQGILPGWSGIRPAPRALEEESQTDSGREEGRGSCCRQFPLTPAWGRGEGAEAIPGAPSDAEPVYWGGLVSFLKGLWWWLFGKWMAVCCEQFFPVWRRRGWNKPSKKEPRGIRFLTLCAAVTLMLVSVLSHGQRTLATTCMCENSSTYIVKTLFFLPETLYVCICVEVLFVLYCIVSIYIPHLFLCVLCFCYIYKRQWQWKSFTQGLKKMKSESHSAVSGSATPWTIQSMEFSRPEYWSG